MIRLLKNSIFPGIILVLFLTAAGCKNTGGLKNKASEPISHSEFPELAKTK